MREDREVNAGATCSSVCKLLSRWAILLAVAGHSHVALATDLTIHLPPGASVSRRTVQYQCDAQGVKLGLPAGPFAVEYINGGGNSLAIVPISGGQLIFSNVQSASGARYTAREFTWWEAKGEVTLYSNFDAVAAKLQSACHPVHTK